MNNDETHEIQGTQAETADFESKFELINPQTIINAGFTGKNVTIAILDSGVNEVGWITNLVGNYTTITNSSMVNDNNGHGTFVGSIISKIAPNAKLISIKVSDSSGYAKAEWVQDGLELALNLNVSIVHASLGSPNLEALNSTIITQLVARNITTVFSAGNHGPFGSSISSPAIFAETIAVGMAYNHTRIPIDSSRGPRPSGLMGPDLVAPGVNITALNHNGEVVNNSGTSFAAPFVTGGLALLQEAFPSASPLILKAALLETAKFMNDTSPIYQGNGFLDISSAYERLNSVDSQPLFAFTPRKLSSEFTYFGHAVNGLNRTYRLGLYTTINSTLNYVNTSEISPINVTIGTPSRNMSTGLNFLNISIAIPKNLKMAKREGNISFEFLKSTNMYNVNLSIMIENRYPGGNILFYQGYDNDSFIPDGPTGRFSQLQHFLELYYGLNTTGAVPSMGFLQAIGSLDTIKGVSGKLTEEDLKNQHILMLADIEFGISDPEITLIQRWVAEGHSLLVLSYPSQLEDGIETLSNQESINTLLDPYGLSIEDDSTNLSRFTMATTALTDPIFEEKGWEFDYIGTTIDVSSEKGGKVLATTIGQSNEEEYHVAGYWEDSESKGKVVVFGGMLPFDDIGVYPRRENLAVITRIFRWMIQDQQLTLDMLLTSSPTIGGSTRIQITIDEPDFIEVYFNGTIIEENESFSQIMFKKSINMYIGSWKPMAAGQALLWLNLVVPGKAPTNGLYIIEVQDSSSQNLFLLLIFGSFIVLGVAYYLLAARQPKKRSPIEQRVAFELQKQQRTPKHAGLDTLDSCPQCHTPRYAKESKYCPKCGKEL